MLYFSLCRRWHIPLLHLFPLVANRMAVVYGITEICGNSIINDVNENGPDLLVSLKVIVAYSNINVMSECTGHTTIPLFSCCCSCVVLLAITLWFGGLIKINGQLPYLVSSSRNCGCIQFLSINKGGLCMHMRDCLHVFFYQ